MKRLVLLTILLPMLFACQRREEASPPTSQAGSQSAPATATTTPSEPAPPTATTTPSQPAPPTAATTPSEPAPPMAATTPSQPAAPSQAQTGSSTEPAAPSGTAAQAPAAAPAAGQTSGSSGEYTVAAGDTLSSIARDHGLKYQDVARWNNIQNPNRIQPGQSLRLTEPNS